MKAQKRKVTIKERENENTVWYIGFKVSVRFCIEGFPTGFEKETAQAMP